ncbi:hypothetical protein L226DRAFT_261368 [Lentinus tigrinus ALCF2SS1-7]|uniref:uncharacterized protein n=1 Tax=Lentinus tigrinus ALCF2SS1-7 TaxID=1328758 RepID=UPI001165F08B|nr:hypothetical protein L226DRAFT_348053 [Lentinus tigrinus ALCF2SS1-7]RPD70071.1 hypothetical protein L226DRAFT_261368 [Lentinus tigrinus ALCF2SS1-7]
MLSLPSSPSTPSQRPSCRRRPPRPRRPSVRYVPAILRARVVRCPTIRRRHKSSPHPRTPTLPTSKPALRVARLLTASTLISRLKVQDQASKMEPRAVLIELTSSGANNDSRPFVTVSSACDGPAGVSDPPSSQSRTLRPDARASRRAPTFRGLVHESPLACMRDPSRRDALVNFLVLVDGFRSDSGSGDDDPTDDAATSPPR